MIPSVGLCIIIFAVVALQFSALQCNAYTTSPDKYSSSLQPNSDNFKCLDLTDPHFQFCLQSTRSGAPVTLELDGWQSHYLNNAIAKVLIGECLGYSLTFNIEPGGDNGYERVATGVVDVNLEVWPSSEGVTKYDYWITETGQTVDAGAQRVLGQSGWYIDNPSLESYLSLDGLFLDFWRTYNESGTVALFPPSFAVNDSLLLGTGRAFVPDWCIEELDPPACNHSCYSEEWINRTCNVKKYNPYCMELVAIDATYDPGILQQQIRNNHLNMTVSFYSEANFYDVAQQRIDSGIPTLLYYWSPTSFIAQNALMRVALRAYSDQCFQNNSASYDGYGSVNCDFPPQSLIKIYAARLQGNDEYDDLIKFVDSFTLTTADDLNMLALLPSISSEWWTASRNVTCQWVKDNLSTWKWWIAQVPPRVLHSLSTSTVFGVRAATIFIACVSLVLHVALFVYRRHPVIRSSSVFFCQLMVAGSWSSYVALWLVPFKGDYPAICFVTPILIAFTFDLSIGSLLSKTLRISYIFNAKRLEIILIRDMALLKYVALLFVYDFILFLLWGVVDLPTSRLHEVGSTTTIYHCDSDLYTMWMALIIAPKAAILFAGSFLAYGVRNVAEAFNESKYIAVCIYNTLVLGSIAILLIIIIGDDMEVNYILLSLAIYLSVFVTQVILFVPKFMMVYRIHKDGPLRKQQSLSLSTPTPMTLGSLFTQAQMPAVGKDTVFALRVFAQLVFNVVQMVTSKGEEFNTFRTKAIQLLHNLSQKEDDEKREITLDRLELMLGIPPQPKITVHTYGRRSTHQNVALQNQKEREKEMEKLPQEKQSERAAAVSDTNLVIRRTSNLAALAMAAVGMTARRSPMDDSTSAAAKATRTAANSTPMRVDRPHERSHVVDSATESHAATEARASSLSPITLAAAAITNSIGNSTNANNVSSFNACTQSLGLNVAFSAEAANKHSEDNDMISVVTPSADKCLVDDQKLSPHSASHDASSGIEKVTISLPIVHLHYETPKTSNS